MASATLSRWARRFLVVGLGFLVLSQVAALAGLPRRTEVVLGLQGFVLTVAFGKAYSLVPSYFDRTLVAPRAPAVHLPLQVAGVVGLAAAPVRDAPAGTELVGAVAWAAAVGVFVTAIAATVGTNPVGRETGTSRANVDRAPLDRLANPFMPIAVGYLVLGTYEAVAGPSSLPPVFDGSPVRVAHLLGGGFALLLLLSVGYRLLPRFLVGSIPRALAAPVLVAGAVGPALVAAGYPSGTAFQIGAALVAVAVVGFAASYLWLFATTDRDRVGFYGPLLGVLAGVGGVGLGVWFAVAGIDGSLVRAHLRLNVFGLLGLAIVGVIYQFYPPATADWPGAGDHAALASLGLLALGLVVVTTGAVAASRLEPVGSVTIGLAGCLTLYLLVGAIASQARRR